MAAVLSMQQGKGYTEIQCPYLIITGWYEDEEKTKVETFRYQGVFPQFHSS